MRRRPDGRIRKLRLSDGKLLWTTTITRDPTHEKITSSLNVSRGLVIATTGGYIGDAPPYQGHVVTMSESSGRIAHVWNSLCSNRHELIVPSTCGSSDSAIWSRNGAAVDPANGNLVVATGNAPFNGSTDWGDSVLVLSPDASRMLRHWTPVDQQRLNTTDLDLGSTSPALLDGGYAVQGGKDGKLRLLQLHRLPGVNARTGGELQTLPTPGGAMLFSAPAVWKGKWVFVATDDGTMALLLRGGRLHTVWSNRHRRDLARDRRQPALRGGQRRGARLRADEREGGREPADRLRPLAEPDRRRRPRRRRRGQRERPRDLRRARHLHAPRELAVRRLRTCGQDTGSGGASRRLAVVMALAGLAVIGAAGHAGASARTAALGIVKIGHFELAGVCDVDPEPAGKLYVVEQAGRIMVLGSKTPFLDIRSLVKSGGEQGLLSMAFDPGYARNHRFYVDYTDRNGDTRVVRVSLRRDDRRIRTRPSSCSSSRTSRRITTAASCSSALTAGSTGGTETGATRAIRGGTARI